MHFIIVKKSSKRSGFVLYSYFKDSVVFKKKENFQSKYVTGVPFVNKRYTTGIPFPSKMLYKRASCWTSGRCLSLKNFDRYPWATYERWKIENFIKSQK